MLGQAAAEAYLQGLPMTACEQHSVLALWPALLRLTAAAPSAAASLSPFAAAAHVVLAERGGSSGADSFSATPRSAFDFSGVSSIGSASGVSSSGGSGAPQQPLDLTFPQPVRADCAAALRFSLSAWPTTSGASAATAEMEVFAAQVNRCIAQSSKEALEDALSELRQRLPSASAVSLVRSSIEGTIGVAGDLLQSSLQTSLRTKMLRRSQSVSLSGEGSESATPLRISLSMSLPPQPE